MSSKRSSVLLFFFILIAVFTVPAIAHDEAVPHVDAVDQVSTDGYITIDSVYSEGPGFIVLHVDNNGAPGGVLGYTWLNPGFNKNVRVKMDASMAEPSPVLFAMLHTDDGEIGKYEFDGSSGLDNPVSDAEGNVITPAITENMLRVKDQQLTDGNKLMVAWVAVPQDSWVVVHKDNEGAPGGVLGQTLVKAGHTSNVEIVLDQDTPTEVVWPMLHIDDGAMGTYEFDGSSGLDNPIAVNGVVATMPIWTVPHIRVDEQIATLGDGMTMAEGEKATITAESVLSDGPGILVVHADDNGNAGAILGATFVPDGLSENVAVELDPEAGITPVVWPMLHIDAGTVGTYDGLEVDTVVSAMGEAVTFQINAAPSMTFSDQALGEGGTVTIDSALIDEPGWLVIHAADGAVLGQAPLNRGLNRNIVIAVDPALAGAQVSPMLHYDTGEAGVYEFDGSNGLDLPTSVGGNVVVAPLNITQ
jgi:hypothetical protein